MNSQLYDLPNTREARLAAESSRLLAACHGHGESATLRLIDDDKEIVVPVKAIHMLADILKHMANGEAISIVPVNAELTTQQAADMLNVSRPFLIKSILNEGKLNYHTVGNRRKLLFKDVLKYKSQQKLNSERNMSELADLSQELDLME